MADRVLRVILTGDAAGLEASMAKADAATDAASDAMGDSVGGLGKDMDEAGKKSEGMVSKLGNFMSNMGLPFGNAMKDAGEKLDETSSKGQHFSQAMSTMGGAALAFGGILAVGVGVESLHMADKFDTAQALMDTAITNSGQSVTAWTPKINDAYHAAANLGFNMTDVADTLQELTTATNSPKEALKALGETEDLARMKGISLSAAGQTMAKVFAGSTRALTQLGINIDIGTGKLQSIRTASEAVTSAQLALKNAEEGVADGQTKAAQAATTLAAAHHNLADAEQKFTLDQGTIAKIMATVAQRTHGAANAFGKTLPGQLDIAKAHLENVGIAFGLLEEKGIKVLERGLVSIVTWFEKNSWAAKILAGIIGTVLGGMVATFAITKVSQFIGGVKNMISGFSQLVAKITGGAAETEVAEEEMATTAEATGTETSAAFGPIGLAIAAIVVAVLLLKSHWKQVWDAVKDAAKDAWKFLDDDVFKPITHFFTAVFIDTIDFAKRTWDTVWGDIKSVAHEAFILIKNWGFILVTFLMGPFIGGLVFVATHWKLVWGIIKTVAADVWHFLDNDVFHPIAHGVTTVIGGAIKGLKTAWDTVWGDIKSVVEAVWKTLSPIFGSISHGLSDIVGLVSKVTGIAGDIGHGAISVGKKLFSWAGTGGLVTKPTILGVAEDGPELILNQQQTRYVMAGGSLGANPMHFSGAQAVAAGGSSQPVYLDVRMIVNGREMANALSPDIRAALLRGGRSTITIGLT